MRPAGGNHTTIRKYVERVWKIPIDHFDPDSVRADALRRSPKALADILTQRSTYSRGALKRRLYETGIKHPRCELCGQGDTWRGRTLSLILDHVNGVPDDNRLENLRIVCPNCAATLDTHCGRNIPVAAACEVCGAGFLSTRGHPWCSVACSRRSEAHRLAALATRRVERPGHSELLAELEASSYVAVGRKYGVSDNAVRKWVRAYARQEELLGGEASNPDYQDQNLAS